MWHASLDSCLGYSRQIEFGHPHGVPRIRPFIVLLNQSKVDREVGYSRGVLKVSPFAFLWTFA